MQNRHLVLVGFLCCTPLSALTGCAPTTPVTPPGTTASAEFNDQATARVIGIDRAHRGLTLQAPDGQVVRLNVTDAVRNFDRINIGDTVRLTVHSRLEVTAAGNQSLPGVIVDQGGARAAPGAKPAGLWALRTQRSVQIVSVDKVGHTVTFREPDGTLDSFTVQNPANYAMADGLQPGSYVTVVETDAVAVSVDKI